LSVAKRERCSGKAPTRTLLAVVATLASACETEPVARSCAGEPVELCAPYEFAAVTAASLEPAELAVADFSLTARVRVELARCDRAPAPHAVEVFALVPESGSESGRLTSLVTLRDGADGDAIEGDGVIEVTIPNPLLVTVPPESEILLRFQPRSQQPLGCTGGALDVPYRTGPFRASGS
jgi:hypothetical protein